MSEATTTRAAMIVIGNEILSGKITDSNSGFLARELRRMGVSLERIVVIPDVVAVIAATVRGAAAEFDLVFTSGGVGPTHDDLTIAGIAEAFGCPVVQHPRLRAAIERVAQVQAQRATIATTLLQHRDHVPVDLDHVDCAGRGKQRDSHRAASRADLDQPVAAGGRDGAHDAPDRPGIVQEVLAQALLGAVHRRRAAHSSTARRSAARRLPASARPVPARSRAVP